MVLSYWRYCLDTCLERLRFQTGTSGKEVYDRYSNTKLHGVICPRPLPLMGSTHPHEIREQRQTKRPVQLDLVLHQNVLQRSAATPLQHQCWSVWVCQTSDHHVQVLVSQSVHLRRGTDGLVSASCTIRNVASVCPKIYGHSLKLSFMIGTNDGETTSLNGNLQQPLLRGNNL